MKAEIIGGLKVGEDETKMGAMNVERYRRGCIVGETRQVVY
jgi:hypothetical protein